MGIKKSAIEDEEWERCEWEIITGGGFSQLRSAARLVGDNFLRGGPKDWEASYYPFRFSLKWIAQLQLSALASDRPELLSFQG